MPIHLKGATPEDIGEVTLLAGDPGRIKSFSSILNDYKVITESREFILINGEWNGKKISACSTGIGVSSTEIAFIELAELGAKCLVRLGGCGAWSNEIKPGDLIINHAVAREEGTLSSYCLDTYPAVADPILVGSLRERASLHKYTVHTGIGLTSQSYYLGQERLPKLDGPKSLDVMDYWTERAIINCDMETAAIYLLASIYKVHVANCLVVHGNRITDQWVPDKEYKDIHLNVAGIVIESCFEALEKIYYLSK